MEKQKIKNAEFVDLVLIQYESLIKSIGFGITNYPDRFCQNCQYVISFSKNLQKGLKKYLSGLYINLY